MIARAHSGFCQGNRYGSHARRAMRNGQIGQARLSRRDFFLLGTCVRPGRVQENLLSTVAEGSKLRAGCLGMGDTAGPISWRGSRNAQSTGSMRGSWAEPSERPSQPILNACIFWCPLVTQKATDCRWEAQAPHAVSHTDNHGFDPSGVHYFSGCAD